MVLGVGVPLVHVLSKLLKVNPQTITFEEKKKEALLGVLIFAAVLAATFGIYGFYERVLIGVTLTADPFYVLRDMLWIALIVLPVVVVLRLRRQSFQSIGAVRKDLRKNLTFGSVTSALLLLLVGVLSPLLGGGFVGFSPSISYLLMSCMVIGFGEEAVFRGYIQTRLTSFLSPMKGVTITSILFVVYNFPLGFFCLSGNVPLTALFAGWKFSTGMLYGYTFHRSQNLLPSSILHVVLVWGGLLFGLNL